MKPVKKKETSRTKPSNDYNWGYNQCIKDQQAYENSIEGLPERKELPLSKEDLTGFASARVFGFNQMHDIAKVLLGKRDERIKELEKEVQGLVEEMAGIDI